MLLDRHIGGVRNATLSDYLFEEQDRAAADDDGPATAEEAQAFFGFSPVPKAVAAASDLDGGVNNG